MLLGFAIGLIPQHGIQPDTSSKDLLLAVTFSHIRAHDEIAGCVSGCGFVHVCLCVCARAIAARDGESPRAIRELGVSSCGAAPHAEPFAACHVLCLGLKSPVALSLQTNLCHWKALGDEGGVRFVSQLHRWSPLRLRSNWGLW